jgi:tetratricopeptide (TPR) repeat protein
MTHPQIQRAYLLDTANWICYAKTDLRSTKEWEGRDRMRDRLQEAIELRATGHAEEARIILLDLVAAYPDDPEINYQTAWVHDNLGREREAAPFYVKAIEQGLAGPDLEGAYLGLGSTYRTLGAYQQAEEMLRRGMVAFPHNRAFQVFLAMTLYNIHRHQEAMELLLTNLAETSSDEDIRSYKRAILFYAPQLNQTWDGE